MRLRRIQARDSMTSTAEHTQWDEDDSAPSRGRSLRSLTLRMRLAAGTALVVIVSMVIIMLAAFTSVSQVLYQEIDKNLQTRAQNIIDAGIDFPREQMYANGHYTARFEETSESMRALIIPEAEASKQANAEQFSRLLGQPENAVIRGEKPFAFNSSDNMRAYAVKASDGRVVVMTQDITLTRQTLDSLRLVLLLVGITGTLGALVAGIAVATAGIQPINRLRRAADRVTETGQLRQIPVYSNDEVGALTTSFNDMMDALQLSQEKQRDLVADAGHELKTPLTSLRTNVEFLMMASGSNNANFSVQDRRDLERDVIAQIDEMSTLIGDLVDLAREDSSPEVNEIIELNSIFDDSLDRVQRRRPDVTFQYKLIPWTLEGDTFSLNRAIRNLLDNAAKWSPEGGVVRVWMEPVAQSMRDGKPTEVEIRIADSGPGIPENERAKVFERFYRSIHSRSMPGSGLGLAIVKQAITRHNGVIVADESDDGGALIRIVLPGKPGS